MNRLHYASSEHDADMLFAAGFFVPDAFLYFESRKQRHIVLSQLEYDRGVKQACVDRVHNLSEIVDRLQKKGATRVPTANWIVEILRRHHVRKVQLSPDFPVGLADALRKRGIRADIATKTLFPERLRKNRDQLKHLRAALRVTAGLLEVAIAVLRHSRVGKNRVLRLGGSSLTSERVQSVIRMEAAKRGFEASHPIVAGGRQACDPHERGHGPLRANELIIIDVFPRDLRTGYWGDMTRTVVKGRASEAQRRLFETVHQGQKLAFARLKSGVDGCVVHEAVTAYFRSKGYETGNKSGRHEGFFHGTGHGLGLDIHEEPRVSSISQLLQTGNVVTVEPGLYYGNIGGVRIEDVAAIRRGGADRLSHFPVRLELP